MGWDNKNFITMKKIIFILFAFATLSTSAQSDGPRAHLPSPTDVWAINVKYMNLDQNILPSGNLQLKNANINKVVVSLLKKPEARRIRYY